ncbi:MAG TPA: hypothetical protein VMU16_06810 [Candidatus Binataceae bacterium]|nr:hypothetical protein [Candidatus Binataceae bacterium]
MADLHKEIVSVRESHDGHKVASAGHFQRGMTAAVQGRNRFQYLSAVELRCDDCGANFTFENLKWHIPEDRNWKLTEFSRAQLGESCESRRGRSTTELVHFSVDDEIKMRQNATRAAGGRTSQRLH